MTYLVAPGGLQEQLEDVPELMSGQRETVMLGGCTVPLPPLLNKQSSNTERQSKHEELGSNEMALTVEINQDTD